MSAENTSAALVLAPPTAQEHIITGLTLGERGRRVAVRLGVPEDRVHVVRSSADVTESRSAIESALGADGTMLMIRATNQVVADSLVRPLEPGTPGTRIAVDPRADGEYAGAMHVDRTGALALLDELAEDFDGGDRSVIELWESAAFERIEVDRRARHPAVTREDVRAADKWQFELVDKPLDSFMAVRVYRPLARPLTRMFLRLPFSPNQITIASAGLSLAGCVVAGFPSYWAHVLGMLILFSGSIVDCNDGEVARLRLEGSDLGAWLDAIGDDLARLAMIAGVGWHVAPRYEDWPIEVMTIGAVLLTLTSMLLIYWYCIFVIGSSNNQDYGTLLGIGPGNDDGPRTFVQKLGDYAAAAARRDFFDIAALGFALVNLPELTFAGLAIGSVVGVAVVIPTHFKLVKKLREEKAAELAGGGESGR